MVQLCRAGQQPVPEVALQIEQVRRLVPEWQSARRRDEGRGPGAVLPVSDPLAVSSPTLY